MPGTKNCCGTTKASPGQHLLEAVSSFRGGALAGAPGRSEKLLHQRLDLIVRDRRAPGSGGRGRPVTVWPMSASAPPGSGMS